MSKSLPRRLCKSFSLSLSLGGNDLSLFLSKDPLFPISWMVWTLLLDVIPCMHLLLFVQGFSLTRGVSPWLQPLLHLVKYIHNEFTLPIGLKRASSFIKNHFHLAKEGSIAFLFSSLSYSRRCYICLRQFLSGIGVFCTKISSPLRISFTHTTRYPFSTILSLLKECKTLLLGSMTLLHFWGIFFCDEGRYPCSTLLMT